MKLICKSIMQFFFYNFNFQFLKIFFKLLIEWNWNGTHLVGLPRLHGRVQFVQHLEQFLVALVTHLAALQQPKQLSL